MDKKTIIPLLLISVVLIFIFNIENIFKTEDSNQEVFLEEWADDGSENPTNGITGSCASKYSVEEELVFYYSDYCSHCAVMKPIVGELEEEGYRFKKVNSGTDFVNECLNGVLSGYVPEFVCLRTDETLLGETSKTNLKRFADNCLG